MAKRVISFSALSKENNIGWINSEVPNHTVINFFSLNTRSSLIVNIHAYLYDATISELNMVCDPFFPSLLAVDEEKFSDSSDDVTRFVRFVFEGGCISFFYKNVCFQTMERKVVMPAGKK
jgi:hypothetical protein